MTGTRPLLTAEEVWRRYDAVETRLTAPVSERMLDLAALESGMRVLDIASGRGEPAIRAAQRVGRTGFVLGVELSEALLRMAHERTAREGLANIDFRAGNAELVEDIPAAYFHAATCRWGLNAMASPIAALERVRRALAAGGVFVAALWAEPERVPYFTLPRRLLEHYRSLPPFDPEVPGTFRYSDVERIVRDFGRAGFTVEHVEEMTIPVIESKDSADLIAWVRALGLTKLLNEIPEDAQQAWEEELTRELKRLGTGGVFRLGGVTRLIVARPKPLESGSLKIPEAVDGGA
jgi:ubiquinone/menaquinone biosynthesis C-methylase UbiE